MAEAPAPAAPAPAGSPAVPSAAPGRPRLVNRPRAVAVVLLAVLSVPLVVALVVLYRPRWYPILDMAQTELRIREVGGRHTPLIGLPGRLGTLDHQGSHPGPLSFWALAPVYRLLGSSSWAMEAAAVSLHVLAMGLGLWIARRRGGLALVLGVAAGLAVLTRAYGTITLTQPWNPYLPVTWWLVYLLAVWSVLDDDLVMLPVAVVAGSFSAQTHIPYVGPVAGLVPLLVAGAVSGLRHHRPRAVRATAGGVVLGALLWLAPVIDQATATLGNASIIRDTFSDPTESPIGIGRAVRVLLTHLDPIRLVTKVATSGSVSSGSLVPGVLLLMAWGAAVALAVRRRHVSLLRLHLVLGASMVLAVAALSRIYGFVWYYLVLWVWGITTLVVLTVVWTVWLEASARLADADRRRWASRGGAALAGVVVVFAALFSVDATSAQPPAMNLSRDLAVLVPGTVAAIDSGRLRGGGREGRYLVTWTDQPNIGARGFGLLDELQRRGLQVGAASAYDVLVTPSNVLDTADATAQIHLAVGADEIAAWRAAPGSRQVAFSDQRTPAERVEYARVRAEVLAGLREAQLDDLVGNVDGLLFLSTYDERVPKPLQDKMIRMLDLGEASAVFLAPPTADA